jgi:tetratricopeptide (TPR) repeat protein
MKLKIKSLIKRGVILAVLIILLLAGCSRGGEVVESGENYLEKGLLLQSEGDYYKALESYMTAADLEPERAEIYYRIGLVYGILHNQEGADRSLIGGKPNRISRRVYTDESHYSRAVHYFRKGADLGHQPSRDILRTMYDNIQHKDVKY